MPPSELSRQAQDLLNSIRSATTKRQLRDRAASDALAMRRPYDELFAPAFNGSMQLAFSAALA